MEVWFSSDEDSKQFFATKSVCKIYFNFSETENLLNQGRQCFYSNIVHQIKSKPPKNRVETNFKAEIKKKLEN